jgi:hypothetical protein
MPPDLDYFDYTWYNREAIDRSMNYLRIQETHFEHELKVYTFQFVV